MPSPFFKTALGALLLLASTLDCVSVHALEPAICVNLVQFQSPNVTITSATSIDKPLALSENPIEDTTWALGHPEKAVDYEYRAEHLTTVVSKQIIDACYAANPAHSCYSGCSAGDIILIPIGVPHARTKVNGSVVDLDVKFPTPAPKPKEDPAPR